MVWEAEIYSHTSFKYGLLDLQQLTGYTIDIYEWIKFKLCDLVWFWNNQRDDAKPILVV